MRSASARTTIAVPCFNEADRFDEELFLRLAEDDQLDLLLVNDGSTDTTGELLAGLAEGSDSISVLNLETNQGKAEAVRRGLLRAIGDGAPMVGYYDADAATPPDQLLRLVGILRDDPQLEVVLGSRVALLGSDIRRSAVRHYAGRAYATLASIGLGITVYDTQCGAKVFRSSPALTQALALPFPSRWTFDVWLIHRLIAGSAMASPLPQTAFVEIPLDAWRDVNGSKMHVSDAFLAFVEIVKLIVKRLVERRSSVK
jgi:glycosyltransferase involved in cell wall biosynthesis